VSHAWRVFGREDASPRSARKPKVEWKCDRCGATAQEDEGTEPDPDMVFWRGVASETDDCDDMVALGVMSS